MTLATIEESSLGALIIDKPFIPPYATLLESQTQSVELKYQPF